MFALGEEPSKPKGIIIELNEDFKKWVSDNGERIAQAFTLPYWYKDNKQYIKSALKSEPTTNEIAERRHAARTPEQVAAIKKAWTDRRIKLYTGRIDKMVNVIMGGDDPSIYSRGNDDKLIQIIKDGADLAEINRWFKMVEDAMNKGVMRRKEENKPFAKIKDGISHLKKIKYNKVKIRKRPIGTDEIISYVSGGDETEGSCSSLAFAYIGNRCGYDVLDFRGGSSLHFFATDRNIVQITKDLGGMIKKEADELTDSHSLLKEVKEGKEYYFSTGKHAAIVRKNAGKVEYLELQSPDPKDNVFTPLDDNALRDRFAAREFVSTQSAKITSVLIDVDHFKDNEDFRWLLGWLNTIADEQLKGANGAMK